MLLFSMFGTQSILPSNRSPLLSALCVSRSPLPFNIPTFKPSNPPPTPFSCHPVPNPFKIRISAKRAHNPCRMRSFKTQDLKGDYVFDTEACYGRETVAGEYLVGILRTGQPCYHSCEMKVEKRKFDQALKKMLRAKPEPRKKIKTQGRRGPKTPILAKP